VRKWDSRVPTRALAELRGHGAAVVSLATDGAGSDVLVSGGADGSVRLWDAATGLSIGCAPGRGASVLGASGTPSSIAGLGVAGG
jgi:WD40 repeat protein